MAWEKRLSTIHRRIYLYRVNLGGGLFFQPYNIFNHNLHKGEHVETEIEVPVEKIVVNEYLDVGLMTLSMPWIVRSEIPDKYIVLSNIQNVSDTVLRSDIYPSIKCKLLEGGLDDALEWVLEKFKEKQNKTLDQKLRALLIIKNHSKLNSTSDECYACILGVNKAFVTRNRDYISELNIRKLIR